jgi:paraquat-inducible protein A
MARTYPLLLPLILFAATFCFALGIVMPLIQVDRLYFFTDQPSLIGIVAGLWDQGDMLLASIVGLFSLAFPALKLALLHCAAYAEHHSPRIPAWFKALANWSMLDVVLVALVVFAAKTSGLATAFTKPGLWFFAASVLLTAAASALAKRGAADH